MHISIDRMMTIVHHYPLIEKLKSSGLGPVIITLCRCAGHLVAALVHMILSTARIMICVMAGEIISPWDVCRSAWHLASAGIHVLRALWPLGRSEYAVISAAAQHGNALLTAMLADMSNRGNQ